MTARMAASRCTAPLPPALGGGTLVAQWDVASGMAARGQPFGRAVSRRSYNRGRGGWGSSVQGGDLPILRPEEIRLGLF